MKNMFADTRYCQNKHKLWALQASAESFTSVFNVVELLLTVLPLTLQGAMGHITPEPCDHGAKINLFFGT